MFYDVNMRKFSFSYILSIYALIYPVRVSAVQTCQDAKIVNGYTRLTFGGKVINFYCHKGFRRFGSRKATCRAGKWSKPTPICYAPGCKKFESLYNGNITRFGSSLMFFECHVGYIIMGYNAAYCNGTSWSTHLPRCTVPSQIRYCDFEYESICGWRQDTKDDFDWKWHKGHTPTGRTGPQLDHTYQSADGDGHYLYLEVSPPRSYGDVARLISPVYGSNTSGQCFQVWYHMMGPKEYDQVGILKIILKKNTTEGNETTLFEIEGNQGDVWHSADVYIEMMNESFQIIIEGTRRKSYVSDIAIDDLRFYDCAVPTTEETSNAKTQPITSENQNPTRLSSQTNYVLVTSPEIVSVPTASVLGTLSISTKTPKTPRKTSTSEILESTDITKITLSNKISSYFVTSTTKHPDVHHGTSLIYRTLTSDNVHWSETSSGSKTVQSSTASEQSFSKDIQSSEVLSSKNHKSFRPTTPSISSTASSMSLEPSRTLSPNLTDNVSNIISTASAIVSENKTETATEKTERSSTSVICNYTIYNGNRAVHRQVLPFMKTYVFVIVAVCVVIVCTVTTAISITVFCRRRKKNYYDNVLEEMKSSFVYKKSVDSTSSKEIL